MMLKTMFHKSFIVSTMNCCGHDYLLESFKNKTSCPTSVVGWFFEQFI